MLASLFCCARCDHFARQGPRRHRLLPRKSAEGRTGSGGRLDLQVRRAEEIEIWDREDWSGGFGREKERERGGTRIGRVSAPGWPAVSRLDSWSDGARRGVLGSGELRD